MVDANSVHDGGKIEVPHSLDEDGEKINVYLNLNIQTHGGEKKYDTCTANAASQIAIKIHSVYFLFSEARIGIPSEQIKVCLHGDGN